MNGGTVELQHSHSQTLSPSNSLALKPRPPNPETQNRVPKLSHSKTLSLYNSSLRRLSQRVIPKTNFNPVFKIIRFFKTYGFYIAIAI